VRLKHPLADHPALERKGGVDAEGGDAVRRRHNTATEGIRLLLRTDPNEEIGEFAQSKVGGAEVAGSAKQALRAVDGAAPSREGDGIVRRNRGDLGDARDGALASAIFERSVTQCPCILEQRGAEVVETGGERRVDGRNGDTTGSDLGRVRCGQRDRTGR